MGRTGKITVHLALAVLAWFAGETLANGSLSSVSIQLALLFGFCAFAAELFLQVERAPWRFLSVGDMLRLARSAAVTTALFIPAAIVTHLPVASAPRAILLAMVLDFVFLASLRIARRALNEGSLSESLLRLRPSTAPSISRGRLLIVGSASEADAFLRSPPSGLLHRYTTVGIISPQEREIGEELRGVCVLGDFKRALDEVLIELAQLLARDGEGATKFVTINVGGASSNGAARKIGLAVANSPLVKTAIAGEDANWGRIVMAVGKAGEPADRDKISVGVGGVWMAKDGGVVPGYDETPVVAHMKGHEVDIAVDIAACSAT